MLDTQHTQIPFKQSKSECTEAIVIITVDAITPPLSMTHRLVKMFQVYYSSFWSLLGKW
jgi:hypothetical protein